MADAGIVRADVVEFWAAQPFDLGLQPHQGNCDLCFLKGRGLRMRILREAPKAGDWWRRMELEQDGFFDRRDRVTELEAEVAASPEFFDLVEGTPEYDAECGDSCGGDSLIEQMALQSAYRRAKVEVAA